jgi:hypothetical protein
MATNTAPPVKIYRSQVQRGLEVAWSKGRRQFATAISNLEKKFSPTPKNSRITWDTSYLTSAFLLLCQVPEDMILSISRNQLVEQVHSQDIQLKPWTVITPLRDPDPSTRSLRKAGIYILYLAKRNGQGLSVPEYESFIDAMMAAIDGGLYSGRSIVDECNRFIKRQSRNKVLGITEIQRSCSKHKNDFASREQGARLQRLTIWGE